MAYLIALKELTGKMTWPNGENIGKNVRNQNNARAFELDLDHTFSSVDHLGSYEQNEDVPKLATTKKVTTMMIIVAVLSVLLLPNSSISGRSSKVDPLSEIVNSLLGTFDPLASHIRKTSSAINRDRLHFMQGALTQKEDHLAENFQSDHHFQAAAAPVKRRGANAGVKQYARKSHRRRDDNSLLPVVSNGLRSDVDNSPEIYDLWSFLTKTFPEKAKTGHGTAASTRHKVRKSPTSVEVTTTTISTSTESRPHINDQYKLKWLPQDSFMATALTDDVDESPAVDVLVGQQSSEDGYGTTASSKSLRQGFHWSRPVARDTLLIRRSNNTLDEDANGDKEKSKNVSQDREESSLSRKKEFFMHDLDDASTRWQEEQKRWSQKNDHVVDHVHESSTRQPPQTLETPSLSEVLDAVDRIFRDEEPQSDGEPQKLNSTVDMIIQRLQTSEKRNEGSESKVHSTQSPITIQPFELDGSSSVRPDEPPKLILSNSNSSNNVEGIFITHSIKQLLGIVSQSHDLMRDVVRWTGQLPLDTRTRMLSHLLACAPLAAEIMASMGLSDVAPVAASMIPAFALASFGQEDERDDTVLWLQTEKLKELVKKFESHQGNQKGDDHHVLEIHIT